MTIHYGRIQFYNTGPDDGGTSSNFFQIFLSLSQTLNLLEQLSRVKVLVVY